MLPCAYFDIRVLPLEGQTQAGEDAMCEIIVANVGLGLLS